MFTEIQSKVQAQFDKLAKNPLFIVDVDREKVWQTYLEAFPEELRQENTCNCCKSFVRQYAGIVAIKNGKMQTMWDFTVTDPEYKKSVKALHEYILSRPVKSFYFNQFAKCGTKSNFDLKNDVNRNHFFIELPKKFINRSPSDYASDMNMGVLTLKRACEEISLDAVDTVLELIDQNSLYRGNTYKVLLNGFRKVLEIPDKNDLSFWELAAKNSAGTNRIKNSSIGKLLVDISVGGDLDKCVRAFEKLVAPANYKRPKAIVTKKQIEQAKKRLEELNLTHSLHRRLLMLHELNVGNSLYVHRDRKSDDIFDIISDEVAVNPNQFSKTEEISLSDFVDKIVPKAENIELLVENRHMNNFVGLVGPEQSEAETLFSWDNNYSWSYSGDVADSIKSRVKKAGGNVSGAIRISLSWSNRDDLDLHVREPKGGELIKYSHKRSSKTGGCLDVDMNAGHIVKDPVENIVYKTIPSLDGEYKIYVNNYTRRDNGVDEGFEVEVEVDGQVHHFAEDSNPRHGGNVQAFTFKVKDKKCTVHGGNSKYSQNEKWGLKTGTFHCVKAITLSPNHWDKPNGNKHTFFLLEGCYPSESIRPFYNEFLKEALRPDRRVFEVLGNKLKIKADKDGLAGLGFSESIKNDFIVRVEGKFKRTLKVKV